LQKNIAASRAERFANADFARAFVTLTSMIFMMTMAADNERIDAMPTMTTKNPELMSFQRERKESLGLDGEIVLHTVGKMMAAAHDLAYFVDAFLNARCGTGARP